MYFPRIIYSVRTHTHKNSDAQIHSHTSRKHTHTHTLLHNRRAPHFKHFYLCCSSSIYDDYCLLYYYYQSFMKSEGWKKKSKRKCQSRWYDSMPLNMISAIVLSRKIFWRMNKEHRRYINPPYFSYLFISLKSNWFVLFISSAATCCQCIHPNTQMLYVYQCFRIKILDELCIHIVLPIVIALNSTMKNELKMIIFIVSMCQGIRTCFYTSKTIQISKRKDNLAKDNWNFNLIKVWLQ